MGREAGGVGHAGVSNSGGRDVWSVSVDAPMVAALDDIGRRRVPITVALLLSVIPWTTYKSWNVFDSPFGIQMVRA